MAAFTVFGFVAFALVAAAFAAVAFFATVFALEVFLVVAAPVTFVFFTDFVTVFFAGAAVFLAGTLDDLAATGFFAAGFVAFVVAAFGLAGLAF